MNTDDSSIENLIRRIATRVEFGVSVVQIYEDFKHEASREEIWLAYEAAKLLVKDRSS